MMFPLDCDSVNFPNFFFFDGVALAAADAVTVVGAGATPLAASSVFLSGSRFSNRSRTCSKLIGLQCLDAIYSVNW
jgi:hypothetical protein